MKFGIYFLLFIRMIHAVNLRGGTDEDYCLKCWDECEIIFHDRFCKNCTEKCGISK